MSGDVRCFVAVGLTDEVREAVGGFLAREGGGIREVRWVRAEQLHLTLKFLGEVAGERIAGLAAALDAGLGARPPFTVELRGAEAFPSARRPRVVWIGCAEGGERLGELAAGVEKALAPLGFPPEQRPFAAHLTVGRVRVPPRDPAPLLRLLARAEEAAFGSFPVPAVALVRSDLFPSGPRYTILHETRLAGAPDGAPRQGSER